MLPSHPPSLAQLCDIFLRILHLCNEETHRLSPALAVLLEGNPHTHCSLNQEHAKENVEWAMQGRGWPETKMS